MPSVLLFCRAEEAKSFVPKVLSDKEKFGWYYLVESRQGPVLGEEFRETLNNGETFETDFIDASTADCGAWALEQQAKNKMIEQDIIAIIDKQSAKDQSIVVAIYVRHVPPLYLGPGKEANTWYEFRVPLEKVGEMLSFHYGNADETWGVYFWRKEELTDERGVFDVDKSTELILQGEGFIPVPEGL